MLHALREANKSEHILKPWHNASSGEQWQQKQEAETLFMPLFITHYNKTLHTNNTAERWVDAAHYAKLRLKTKCIIVSETICSPWQPKQPHVGSFFRGGSFWTVKRSRVEASDTNVTISERLDGVPRQVCLGNKTEQGLLMRISQKTSLMQSHILRWTSLRQSGWKVTWKR